MTDPNPIALESIVDHIGLAKTLDLLASLCRDKAEHLRSNWQDDTAARVWEKAARHVEASWDKVHALDI